MTEELMRKRFSKIGHRPVKTRQKRLRVELLEQRQLLSVDLVSTALLSQVAVTGDGHFQHPSISADGRYIAFASDANNLMAGDTNNRRDIFLRYTLTGEIKLVDHSGTLGTGRRLRHAGGDRTAKHTRF
jgi:dipeptidyl aminopeptidase/acylaminoacyl peptidase